MLKFEATSKKNYSINRPLYKVCILKFKSYSDNETITYTFTCTQYQVYCS